MFFQACRGSQDSLASSNQSVCMDITEDIPQNSDIQEMNVINFDVPDVNCRQNVCPSVYINTNYKLSTACSENQSILKGGVSLVPYEIESDELSDSPHAEPVNEDVLKDRNEIDYSNSEPGELAKDRLLSDIEKMNETRKRKKIADPAEWKRLKNKQLRMEGKEYLGYRKKKGEKIVHDTIRREREMGMACNSARCNKSKNKNCFKFKEETRKNIFKKFWNEMNWAQRKVVISSNVFKGKKARGEETSRRQSTYTYFLNNGEEQLQVCRKMFVNTLDIGYKTIQEWVSKSSYGMGTDIVQKDR
ncbi:unnamed protein product [Acanthoscelides obtectus]|nr:unnamed protein product [Acanthoscelides obtectus]CAK1688850.1 hypothetical protein AOBTE_LOCUS36923 [Acanthoscelides obtectus]